MFKLKFITTPCQSRLRDAEMCFLTFFGAAEPQNVLTNPLFFFVLFLYLLYSCSQLLYEFILLFILAFNSAVSSGTIFFKRCISREMYYCYL